MVLLNKLSLSLSNKTKKLAKATSYLAIATLISRYRDISKISKAKNGVISAQTFYIEELENFIEDLIGEEKFLQIVEDLRI